MRVLGGFKASRIAVEPLLEAEMIAVDPKVTRQNNLAFCAQLARDQLQLARQIASEPPAMAGLDPDPALVAALLNAIASNYNALTMQQTMSKSITPGK